MKKILLLALSVVGAAGAYAQGTIIFADNVNAAGIQIDVYSPQLATPGVMTTGNSAADTPPGTTVYTGVPLGGGSSASGPTGYANGNNYTAELYALGGTSLASFSALQPVSQYTTTFFTVGAGAGLFKGVNVANDPGIPNSSSGSATVSLAAWYNGGGTITSVAAAQSAGVPYGWSTPYVQGSLGNIGSPPSTPTALTGLTSFSLITPTSVPEPGTITLAVMGAAGFLMRRRSK